MGKSKQVADSEDIVEGIAEVAKILIVEIRHLEASWHQLIAQVMYEVTTHLAVQQVAKLDEALVLHFQIFFPALLHGLLP